MLHQFGNVGHAVVGRGAGAKRGAANVDGVCAMVDGFDANVQIAGRGEEFELVGEHGAGLSQE
jgi:hypothetical protein